MLRKKIAIPLVMAMLFVVISTGVQPSIFPVPVRAAQIPPPIYLPWAGTAHVSQGPCPNLDDPSRSHCFYPTDDQAYDFTHLPGGLVRAAAAGTIVRVVNEYDPAPSDVNPCVGDYVNHANFIIEQLDGSGTLLVYQHEARDTGPGTNDSTNAFVYEGLHVSAGWPIGHVGNTGCALGSNNTNVGGEHLHFAVVSSATALYGGQSKAFTFSDVGLPVAGQDYTSGNLPRPLPGGWWIGPTPSDYTPINQGNSFTVNFTVNDNNNNGINHVDITTWSSSDKQWHVVYPLFRTVTTIDSGLENISTQLAMPNAYFEVSVNVYSNDGAFQLAPSGIRHYCAGITNACNASVFPSDGTAGGLGGGSGSGSGGGDSTSTLLPSGGGVTYTSIFPSNTLISPGATLHPDVKVSITGFSLDCSSDFLRYMDGWTSGWGGRNLACINQGGGNYEFPSSDTVTAASSPGTYVSHWQLWHTGAAVGPVIALSYAIQQAVCTTAPTTTSSVTGAAPGKHGWWLSTVFVTLTAASACGTPGLQTHYSINGGSWNIYTAPIPFNQEGEYTLSYYTDGIGPAESTHTIAIDIDWSPPVTTATATGARDTNGIFRGDITAGLQATDNLSGVDYEEYSTDGGQTWTDVTGSNNTFAISGEGVYRFLYRSVDIAGNVESPHDSGPIIINKYTVFSNGPGQSLSITGVTGSTLSGDMHSNGAANISNDTHSTLGSTLTTVEGGNTLSGNTGVTLPPITTGVAPVTMLAYPLSLYQQIATVVFPSDLYIDSVNTPINGIVVSTGSIYISAVHLSGSATFVAQNDINDTSTDSTFKTDDPYNGVLDIAGRNININSTGSRALGLYYAPNGTVYLVSTGLNMQGSVVGNQVVLDGTTGLTLNYNPAFSNATYQLPLSAMGAVAPIGPPPPLPSVPSAEGADQTAADPTTTIFFWSSSANAFGYQIQVSTTSSFNPGTIVSDTSHLATDSTTQLTPGTAFYWRVRAINQAGYSGWSTTATYTTPGSSAPATPTASATVTHTPSTSTRTMTVLPTTTTTATIPPTTTSTKTATRTATVVSSTPTKSPSKSPTPTVTASPTSTTTSNGSTTISSFEDGTTDGWSASGTPLTSVSNSTAQAFNGTNSLAVTAANFPTTNYPWIQLPHPSVSPGQPVTAHVWIPSGSSFWAQMFVSDANYVWWMQGYTALTPGIWNTITYTIPAGVAGPVYALGIQFENTGSSAFTGALYVDAVQTSTTISGTPTVIPTKTSTPTSAPITTATKVNTATPIVTATPQVTIVTAAVAPTSVKAGGTVTLNTSLISDVAFSGIVDLEIIDSAGNKVAQPFLGPLPINAGGPQSFQSQWSVPTNTTPGTYTLTVGVFGASWGNSYTYRSGMATIVVGAAATQTSTPIAGSTSSPTVTPSVTPTVRLTVTETPTTGGAATIASFEDDTVGGWQVPNLPLSGVSNSTAQVYDGTHSLAVTASNFTTASYPWVQLLHPQVSPGQTITAHVWIPSGSGFWAQLFVSDANYTWWTQGFTPLTSGVWNTLTYTVPSWAVTPTYALGIQFLNAGSTAFTGTFYVDAVAAHS